MQIPLQYRLFLALLFVAGMISCSRTALEPAPRWQPEDFNIEKLNRNFVQAGEELTVYGNKLTQTGSKTEVFLNGRPAAILNATADSVRVLVPLNAQTGKLMLTISKGKDFKTMYGPNVEVKPTPVIRGFFPYFATRGEMVELYTEHFSYNNTDNSILLDGKQVKIVSRRQDTLVVQVPADASDGMFSWSTFNGPLFSLNERFRIRKHQYAVNTVADWLKADPAFSYMDTLVRGFKQIADPYYFRIYDSAMNYIASPDSTFTIFLSSDLYYYNTKLSKTDFISRIKSRPYEYNNLMAAAIVAGYQLDLATVQDGAIFNTIYTMKMQWEGQGTDDANFVRIINDNGVQYAQIEGMYGETRPRVRILKEHKMGKATLIELESELGYVAF
jgi:hypothetical protein